MLSKSNQRARSSHQQCRCVRYGHDLRAAAPFTHACTHTWRRQTGEVPNRLSVPCTTRFHRASCSGSLQHLRGGEAIERHQDRSPEESCLLRLALLPLSCRLIGGSIRMVSSIRIYFLLTESTKQAKPHITATSVIEKGRRRESPSPSSLLDVLRRSYTPTRNPSSKTSNCQHPTRSNGKKTPALSHPYERRGCNPPDDRGTSIRELGTSECH